LNKKTTISRKMRKTRLQLRKKKRSRKTK